MVIFMCPLCRNTYAPSQIIIIIIDTPKTYDIAFTSQFTGKDCLKDPPSSLSPTGR